MATPKTNPGAATFYDNDRLAPIASESGKTVRLTADFSKPVRPMGKQNGTNNGPLHTHHDETEAFLDMGVDFVRFHETHSPYAKCIEVPYIFRNFDADENDPANYFFDETDAVITAAVKAGCEIMYRFGMGTESTEPRLYCLVPKDYEKWARIVIHILRHYNEGWANGFHYGIRYVEIWNEADLYEYWPGPQREYTKFYCVTSKMIKAYDPNLLISPSGFASVFHLPHNPKLKFKERPAGTKKGRIHTGKHGWSKEERGQFFRDFMETVIAEKAPMDYFSWHYYGNSSLSAKTRVDAVVGLLKEYGFGDLEHINTEWSCVHLKRDANGRWDRSQRDTMKSAIGVLSTMLVFQNAGTTKSAYYDADSRSEFFGALTDFTHKPRNHYHSLKAFKLLRRGETECETTGETDNVRVCAAGNGKEHWVCVTCEDADTKISLKPAGIEACKVRWWLLDETHKLEVVRTGRFNGRAIPMKLEANSAVLLEFLAE